MVKDIGQVGKGGGEEGFGTMVRYELTVFLTLP